MRSLLPPLSLPLALTCLSFLALHALALQPICYWKYLNRLDSAANDGPCGAVNGTETLECCSSGDTCIGSNICHGPGGSHDGGSGYYLTGCTDSTYEDSTCTPHCISNGYPDIVYNSTTELWACCTVIDFKVDCQNPTTEVWSAPAPSALNGTFVAHSATASPTLVSTSSSAFSSSVSSSTTTIPPTTAAITQASTPSASIDASASGSLSTGAKAGISIGAGFAFLAFFGLTIAFIGNRRKAQVLTNSVALQNARMRTGLGIGKTPFSYGGAAGAYTQVPEEWPVQELASKPAAVATSVGLSATVSPAELGHWDNYYSGNFGIPAPSPKKNDTYYHP